MIELFEKIEHAEHIVLIAHVNPDADSVGSACAMYSHLLRFSKKVTLFCQTERMNPNLACIPWFEKIKHTFPARCDLAVSFDCGAKKRLGNVPDCALVNIDHHISNENYGELNIVDMSAISTTQVLYDLFKGNNIKINPKMATALYAGLLDDSHGFTSDKTDQRSFEMAADLVKSGADIALCSQTLFQRTSLAALRLKGLMLQNVKLLHGAMIASLMVTREMMESTGALEVDCEAALEESMHLPTVKTALMLRQNRDGSIKGSLRGDGTLNLSDFAASYGGGGHVDRAGFNVKGMTLEALEEEIILAIQKEMN